MPMANLPGAASANAATLWYDGYKMPSTTVGSLNNAVPFWGAAHETRVGDIGTYGIDNAYAADMDLACLLVWSGIEIPDATMAALTSNPYRAWL